MEKPAFPDEHLLVCERDAAKMLSLSVRSLFTLRRSGLLPHCRVLSKILYDISDLRAFILKSKQISA